MGAKCIRCQSGDCSLEDPNTDTTDQTSLGSTIQCPNGIEYCQVTRNVANGHLQRDCLWEYVDSESKDYVGNGFCDANGCRCYGRNHTNCNIGLKGTRMRHENRGQHVISRYRHIKLEKNPIGL